MNEVKKQANAINGADIKYESLRLKVAPSQKDWLSIISPHKIADHGTNAPELYKSHTHPVTNHKQSLDDAKDCSMQVHPQWHQKMVGNEISINQTAKNEAENVHLEAQIKETEITSPRPNSKTQQVSSRPFRRPPPPPMTENITFNEVDESFFSKGVLQVQLESKMAFDHKDMDCNSVHSMSSIEARRRSLSGGFVPFSHPEKLSNPEDINIALLPTPINKQEAHRRVSTSIIPTGMKERRYEKEREKEREKESHFNSQAPLVKAEKADCLGDFLCQESKTHESEAGAQEMDFGSAPKIEESTNVLSSWLLVRHIDTDSHDDEEVLWQWQPVHCRLNTENMQLSLTRHPNTTKDSTHLSNFEHDSLSIDSFVEWPCDPFNIDLRCLRQVQLKNASAMLRRFDLVLQVSAMSLRPGFEKTTVICVQKLAYDNSSTVSPQKLRIELRPGVLQLYSTNSAPKSKRSKNHEKTHIQTQKKRPIMTFMLRPDGCRTEICSAKLSSKLNQMASKLNLDISTPENSKHAHTQSQSTVTTERSSIQNLKAKASESVKQVPYLYNPQSSKQTAKSTKLTESTETVRAQTAHQKSPMARSDQKLSSKTWKTSDKYAQRKRFAKAKPPSSLRVVSGTNKSKKHTTQSAPATKLPQNATLEERAKFHRSQSMTFHNFALPVSQERFVENSNEHSQTKPLNDSNSSMLPHSHEQDPTETHIPSKQLVPFRSSSATSWIQVSDDKEGWSLCIAVAETEAEGVLYTLKRAAMFAEAPSVAILSFLAPGPKECMSWTSALLSCCTRANQEKQHISVDSRETVLSNGLLQDAHTLSKAKDTGHIESMSSNSSLVSPYTIAFIQHHPLLLPIKE